MPKTKTKPKPKIPKGHFHTVGKIATPDELRVMWTDCINDPGYYIKDRLKASELLGKSLAMFTDKLEHSGDSEKPIRHVYTLGTKNLGGPV